MKRSQLIGSVILASGFFWALTLVRYPTMQNQSLLGVTEESGTSQASRTPIRYMRRLLPLAARSLAYLPKMGKAIAAHSPSRMLAAAAFEKAEVSLFGVAPLRVGMTLAEAEDAIGISLTPIGSNLTGQCAYYQPDVETQEIGVMVVDDRIIRIDIWPGSTLKTISGARIGLSEEEVIELYPDEIEATPNPYTGGKFLTLVPADPELSPYRMVFETDGEGTVVQYRTGQFPAVTWPDGCV